MNLRRSLVLLLVVPGIAWAGASLAATKAPVSGCEDRLVETLTVQLSGPEATSKPIQAGFTYKIVLEGANLSSPYLPLNFNGVDPGWSPRDRPTLVLSPSTAAIAYGSGAIEDIYAASEQQGAGLRNAGTCLVKPRPSWKTLPGSPGALRFTPFTRAGAPPDTRTVTVKIYQSVWTEATGPSTTTAPTTTSPAAASPVGLWSRNGRRYRWRSIPGGFEVVSGSAYRLTNGCVVLRNVPLTRYRAIGGGLFRSYSRYFRARAGGAGSDGLNCGTYWRGPEKTVSIRVTAMTLIVSCDKQPTSACRVYTRLRG